MAVGYLEHDRWLPEYKGSQNMGKPGGKFCYAVVELPSDSDVGVAFWNGCVFSYRDDSDDSQWYTPKELHDFVRNLETGRDEDFSSVSDIIDYADAEEIVMLEIYAFANDTDDLGDYDTGLYNEDDRAILGELLEDLQRFWRGVDWSEKEAYASSD